MKAHAGKTPPEITLSPFPGVEDSIEVKSQDTETISRSSQPQIRRHCLERDGNKCLATGLYSNSHAHPPNAITTYLSAAHIIPFTLGSFEAVDGNATVWINLKRYFPVLHSMSFTSEHVHSEKKVLVLDNGIGRIFGQFSLIFEATGVAHQYKIKAFPDFPTSPLRDLPKNRLVKFRVHKGS